MSKSHQGSLLNLRILWLYNDNDDDVGFNIMLLIVLKLYELDRQRLIGKIKTSFLYIVMLRIMMRYILCC